MNGNELTPDMDSLLVHADFVRGLAKSILFDDHRVDDVVQQTWLAALKSRPEKLRSERAWLATVTRNQAIKEIQKKTRVEDREEKAAQPEGLPSASEIVEKEAARKELVDSVLALEEPYRSAILLRYYEDLPPREIAKRTDLPIDTVYTHCKRGLEKLRASLDAKHGGNRQAWCLGLIPLGLPAKTHAAGAVAATAVSVLVISSISWVLADSFSGKAPNASAPKIVRSASEPSSEPLSEPSPADSAISEEKLTAVVVTRRSSSEKASRTTLETEPEKIATKSEQPHKTIPLSGIVHEDGGRPLPGAEVFVLKVSSFFSARLDASQFTNYAEQSGWMRLALRTQADASGKFAFEDLSAFPEDSWGSEEDEALSPELMLFARANLHLAAKAGPFPLANLPESVTLLLERAASLEGIVLNAEDGRPMTGVRISCNAPSHQPGVNHYETFADAKSDAEGKFRLQSVPYGKANLFASFEGYKDFRANLNVSEGTPLVPMEIKLSKEDWEILGHVLTPEGKPVPDSLWFSFGENRGSLGYGYFSIFAFRENPEPLLAGQSFDSQNIDIFWPTHLMQSTDYQESDGSFRIYPFQQRPWTTPTAWVVLQADGMKPQIHETHRGDGPVDFVLDPKEIEKKAAYFLLQPVDPKTGKFPKSFEYETLTFPQHEIEAIGAGMGNDSETIVHRVPGGGKYDLLLSAKGCGWVLLRGLSIKDGERISLGKIVPPVESKIRGKVKMWNGTGGMKYFDSQGRSIGSAEINSDGSFEIARLGADRIRIEVDYMEKTESGWKQNVTSAEVNLREGETEEIEIPLKGTKN